MSAARFLIAVVTVAWIIWQLSGIGWQSVLQALPSTPIFYAVLLVLYFVSPLADRLVYGRIWHQRLPLRLFLHKRFINNTLFDYSGEAYLLVWAKRNLPISDRLLAHSLKDNAVLSAAGALVVLAGLLAGLAAAGELRLPTHLGERQWPYVLLAGVPLFLGAGYLIARKHLTMLSARQVTFVFAVHLLRSLSVQFLQVALWMLHIPSVSLAQWLNFLAVKLIISRVPLLPNKELIFVGAGIGVAGAMQLPHDQAAAVLLTIFAGEQIFNLIFLGLPAFARSAISLLTRQGSQSTEPALSACAPVPHNTQTTVGSEHPSFQFVKPPLQ